MASKVKKKRLDVLVVEQGLAESRTRAQSLIMAGRVFCDENKLDKAGTKLPEDTQLTLRGRDHPWVSRGGLKLQKAIDHFGIRPDGAVCIDVGASTGGFTDVLLHYGARKVYAVDVGYGQLANKLRDDDRVVVMERFNARHIRPDDIDEKPGWVVCDASFIGLETLLPATLKLVADSAVLVALVKPQFEVGKDNVGRGGVVRDAKLHKTVCDRISNWLDSLDGWSVQGLIESPITGPQGNVEFLVFGRYKR